MAGCGENEERRTAQCVQGKEEFVVIDELEAGPELSKLDVSIGRAIDALHNLGIACGLSADMFEVAKDQAQTHAAIAMIDSTGKAVLGVDKT